MKNKKNTNKNFQQENKNLVKEIQKLRSLISYQEEQIKTLADDSKSLILRDKELSKIRTENQIKIEELDRTAKQLVRRDFELTSANEQLQELEQLKSRVVMLLSHQLLTPVSIIQWTLSMLNTSGESSFNKQQERLIKDAMEENKNLAEIIDGLLTMSQLESCGVSIRKNNVNMVPLIHSVYERWEREALRRKLDFKLDLPRNKEINVSADKKKLIVAIGNIVGNALFYTSEGSVTVKLRDEKDKKKCIIEIKDTGIGIDPKDLANIYDCFFRGENAMLKHTHGIGFGLYISKQIIDAHGGEIKIRSKLNKGTTVTIIIPNKSK